jgi:CHASE3 domain sensor protein
MQTSIDINPMELIRKYGFHIGVGALLLGIMVGFTYVTVDKATIWFNNTTDTSTSTVDVGRESTLAILDKT